MTVIRTSNNGRIVIRRTVVAPVRVTTSGRVISPAAAQNAVIVREEAAVQRIVRTRETVTIGVPGVQGPPGEDGTTGTSIIVEKTAGEALGGHRMVRITGGKAMYADARFADHGDDVFGMTTQAAALDDAVQIVTYGQITEPSWAWAPEEPLFLSQDGLLSQTPDPSMAFDLIVGFAETSTTILLDVSQAIYYED